MKMVLGFMFNEDRTQVALILKQRPDWQAGLLNGVGGHVEGKEGTVPAMCREFKEETGYYTSCDDWEMVGRMHDLVWSRDPTYPDIPEEVFIFRCLSEIRDLRIVLRAPNSLAEAVWVCEPNKLPPNVLFNLRWLIPLCLDIGYNGPRYYHVDAQVSPGEK